MCCFICSELLQLCDLCDSHINMRDPVPGTEIHHSGFGKTEDGLELADGCGSGRAIDTVGSDIRDGRIDRGDGIKLFLHLLYLRTGGAEGQIFAGP